MATIHPSAIVRMRGDERELELKAFVEDLRVAAGALAQ
jgi:hypothetical protein